MSYPLLTFALGLAMFCTFGAHADEEITNQSIGVSITPPSGWKLMSEAARNAGASGNDFKEFVYRNSPRPFLVLVKLRAEGPIPTIQGLLAPLSSEMTRDPVRNLERMSSGPARAFQNYKLVEKTAPATFGGMAGAHNRATYTQPGRDGAAVLTSFDSFYAIRGEQYFLVGIVAKEPEDEATQREIKQFLSTFKIAPDQK